MSEFVYNIWSQTLCLIMILTEQYLLVMQWKEPLYWAKLSFPGPYVGRTTMNHVRHAKDQYSVFTSSRREVPRPVRRPPLTDDVQRRSLIYMLNIASWTRANFAEQISNSIKTNSTITKYVFKAEHRGIIEQTSRDKQI